VVLVVYRQHKEARRKASKNLNTKFKGHFNLKNLTIHFIVSTYIGIKVNQTLRDSIFNHLIIPPTIASAHKTSVFIVTKA